MTGSFESLDSRGRKELADRILESVIAHVEKGADELAEIVGAVAEELAIGPDQVKQAIVAGQGRRVLDVNVNARGRVILTTPSLATA